MPRKRLHKLDYTPEFNFRLLGIVSDVPDYRLSWSMNNSLDWQLNREENLVFPAGDVQQEFSCYSYHDGLSQLSYQLVANRGPQGFLLEELRNIDFLLKVSGGIRPGEFSVLISRIRSLDTVRAVFEADPAGLRSKHRLIF